MKEDTIKEIKDTMKIISELSKDISKYTKLKEMALNTLLEHIRNINYFPAFFDNIDSAVEYIIGKSNNDNGYNYILDFLNEYFDSEKITDILHYTNGYCTYAYGVRFNSNSYNFEFFIPCTNVLEKETIGAETANFGKLGLFVLEEDGSSYKELVSSYDIKDLKESFEEYIMDEFTF